MSTPRSGGEHSHFALPHKPSDMDLATWSALLARSQGVCELHCAAPCDSRLEVDHLHSRALGGETSLANCRLICAVENRRRGVANDPKWTEVCWFDENKNFEQLRYVQKLNAPLLVEAYADLFVVESLRRQLLSAVSLLFMVCGTGKTLTMTALMLAINKEVNARIPHAPRCRRVLWFVNERGLAIQLKNELKKEVTKYGLHYREPSVAICTKSGDLEKNVFHNDITISCPHSLWPRKESSKTQILLDTPEKRAAVLAKFDVIIWDECDFAKDRIKELVELAPHALKFGLTAGPIDKDGNLLVENFVLAGVASYQDAFKHDHCLKVLLPWNESLRAEYVKPVVYDGYSYLVAGKEEHALTGRHDKNVSLPSDMWAIRAAINDCSALERKMRKAWPHCWYSPHILVRCSSILEAQHLCDQTNKYLANVQDMLIGNGWKAGIFVSDPDPEHSGRGKSSDKAQNSLFHQDPSIVHPQSAV
jgi:Type III restriction enzyme, res subunit/HNH endonuclease